MHAFLDVSPSELIGTDFWADMPMQEANAREMKGFYGTSLSSMMSSMGGDANNGLVVD